MREEISRLFVGQTQRGLRFPTNGYGVVEDIPQLVKTERSEEDERIGEHLQGAIESRRQDIEQQPRCQLGQ